MADPTTPISVRLDAAALSALEKVSSQRRLNRSQAIRVALIETAGRGRTRARLAVEARALAEDEVDRAEMADVRALMESLRAEG